MDNLVFWNGKLVPAAEALKAAEDLAKQVRPIRPAPKPESKKKGKGKKKKNGG